MLVFVTQFCADREGEESTYAQVHGSSSSQRFQDVYWRCIVAWLGTLKHTCPNSRAIVCTNVENPVVMAGNQVRQVVSAFRSEFWVRPFTFVPDVSLASQWRATNYKFDALRACLDQLDAGSTLVLTDSDCVFVGDPETQINVLLSDADVLAYEIEYAPNAAINGLSRNALMAVYADFGAPVTEPPKHYGGEFLAIKQETLARFLGDICAVWTEAMGRAASGQESFKTEEHILSYILNTKGYRVASAKGLVKRIWTQPSYRNTENHDLDIPIWHLPAEKQFGITEICAQILAKGELAGSPEQYKRYISERLGVPEVSQAKRIRDKWRRVVSRLKVG